MKDTRKLTVAFIVIGLSVVLVMLALSTLAGQAQDEGYPAPIDYGYPIGYPVDYGYPIYDPYPIEYGYPVDIGYPIFDPVPLPDYPEPVASSPELSSNPVQLEPITPQYRNGRNLWQEIMYHFSKLLGFMK